MCQYNIERAYERIDETVIRMLMDQENMAPTRAYKLWMQSKTRKYLHDHNMHSAVPGSCKYELDAELRHDPTWMTEPI